MGLATRSPSQPPNKGTLGWLGGGAGGQAASNKLNMH